MTKTTMAAAVLLALGLAGCAVEWSNREVVREEVQRMAPPGSVYTGWRVFQDKCASCHGPAATGTAGGPDLLPRVREMGERRFVGLVLQRYDWGMPGETARASGPAQDALVEDVVQRRARGARPTSAGPRRASRPAPRAAHRHARRRP
ncbi:cytochrome c [Calidifontimicrobium sp. SYSU G02091]|uniref:c-type cytochrome n=1 Tax=Calidifontimicrobium sp. SYSU G02091 TaxID=2926421 RepID=UPI001F53A26F|nr:c-type cytochrome [Calidifontimicrobium sp. SYSU G02091]MCI1190315.1 cytochrome c [Calidifontimicrobium sp. SYSU G02091]